MEHDHNPVPVIDLNPERQRLCQALEDLHEWGMGPPETGERRRRTPTEMFKGALFVAQPALEGNTDWIAQATHSLREVLYPFLTGDRSRSPVSEEEWRFYQDFLKKAAAGRRVRGLWDRLNGFAHHRTKKVAFTREGFDELLDEFQRTMRHAQPVRPELLDDVDATASGGPDKISPHGREE